jgi:ribonuclease HI
MADAMGLWESIQALTGEDRKWLFAQLAGWLPFQHFLASRQMGVGSLGPPTVVFDGGSRGNPGPAYGTYALQFGDEPPQMSHLEFENEMTNNEAEYEVLIRSLEDLRGRIAAMGAEPRQYEVVVQGDSRLVINQVTGAWKARDPRMLQRRNRVRELVRSFGRVSFQQRQREEIEKVLGH